MTGEHLDQALIAAFVEGDLDTGTAVLAAEHLDRCPFCAALAAQAEPLAMAFARSADPMLPEGFEAAVLAAAANPTHGTARTHGAAPPATEGPAIVVGAALLVLASSLMVLGDWVSAARETLLAAHATQALANAVAAGMPGPLTLFPLTALTGALCVVVLGTTTRQGGMDALWDRIR